MRNVYRERIVGSAALFPEQIEERITRYLLGDVATTTTAASIAASAYSVLTHEANIDALWDSSIKSLLLARFPENHAPPSWRRHAPMPMAAA